MVKNIWATDLISPLSLAPTCIRLVSGRPGSFFCFVLFCIVFNHHFIMTASHAARIKPLTTPDTREVTGRRSDVSGARDEVGRTRLRDWFDGPVPM